MRRRAHLAVQFLHGDQIEGLERVSVWGDEIQADVDSGVMAAEQRALYLQLLLEVFLKLGIDVVQDGLVAAHMEQKDRVAMMPLRV